MTGMKKNETVVIGLTGSYGCGKTTVARMLKKLGAAVIDADKLAHLVYKKNTAAYKKIVKAFGMRILKDSGEIDRRKLGTIAFRNKSSLKLLCGIVHPAVLKNIKIRVNRLVASGRYSAVVIDAPLLIETGLHDIVHLIIVIRTSNATQIRRINSKTGISKREIAARINSQMALRDKIRLADHVINNEGNLNSTYTEVKKIWRDVAKVKRRRH